MFATQALELGAGLFARPNSFGVHPFCFCSSLQPAFIQQRFSSQWSTKHARFRFKGKDSCRRYSGDRT